MPSTVTPQWKQALDAGNEIRYARAAVKRNLKKGPRPEAWKRAALIVLDPPEHVDGMELGDLLRATHRMGPEKTRYILARLHIGEGRKVGDLSERQKTALFVQLTGGASIPRTLTA